MVLSDLDRDLLTQCLSEKDGAWEAFIDRYLALITHVVARTAELRHMKLPPEIRDDIVSEILLALVDDGFAILRRFKGQSSLGTYLVVVSRRIAARRLTKLAPSLKTLQLQESDAKNANGQVQLQVEDKEELESLLGDLPDGEATAIRMFHLEHKSYGDIGNHMGIPENSVGPLLSKARKRMRGMRSGG